MVCYTLQGTLKSDATRVLYVGISAELEAAPGAELERLERHTAAFSTGGLVIDITEVLGCVWLLSITCLLAAMRKSFDASEHNEERRQFLWLARRFGIACV